MRRMECDACGCLKSQHVRRKGKDSCLGCWEVWQDNYKEYIKSLDTNPQGVWHKFKLNNLKWLEEQYEKTL